MLLVIALLAIILGRWHYTSTRRDAFDRLARLPCGFVSRDDGGTFTNPSDMLGMAINDPVTDFFSPPRVYSIHIRTPLTNTERQQFLRLTTAFSELRLVALSDSATDNDFTFWREKLADNIFIE